MQLIKQNTNINFVSKMKYGLILSAIVCVIGWVSVIGRGENNFGIDFTGGLVQQVAFTRNMTSNELRESLKSLNNVQIQKVHNAENEFILRSAAEEKEPVLQALESAFPDKSYSINREEMVGPSVGRDLRKQGVLSLLFALLGILIYVSWRFEFRFAVGAIAALFHDVLITIGLLSLFNVDFTLQILAALLTIVGYSLNDTIVVFDRIRESVGARKKETFSQLVNVSVNQTLSRTILTSLTTFFVVTTLFLLGGEVIRDFALALMIGVVVGTYSSIFIASAVLVQWQPPVKK